MRTLLALLCAATFAAPAAADELAASRKAADFVLTLSDSDYEDLVKSAREEQKHKSWTGKSRTAVASGLYRGLAAKHRAAAGATKASASVGEDAQAAAPDAALLTESSWLSDFSSYMNQRHAPRIGGSGVAIAGVRGGRKLNTADDKAVMRALEAADEAEKAGRPLDAAQAYEAAAAVLEKPLAKAEPKPAPAAPAPAAARLTPQEIYKRASPSVVLIIASDGGGQGELGTGSIVAGGRVLTNAHVVVNDKTGRPFSTVRVYLKPLKLTGDTKRDIVNPIEAQVAKYDRGLDLAVLTLSRKPQAGELALGDDGAVEPGEPVVAIGHPEQGGLWTLTQGVVSTVIADLGGVKGKDAFQTDASINRGNSGGPLLDERGSIVGVNTSMARKAADGLTITSVNFSVRSSVARRFMDLPPDAGRASVMEAPPVAPAETAPQAAPEPAPRMPEQPRPQARPAEGIKPAPQAELPPPPKTQPVILTPVRPYKEQDAIAAGIQEMEDLESEMRGEIERRRGGN